MILQGHLSLTTTKKTSLGGGTFCAQLDCQASSIKGTVRLCRLLEPWGCVKFVVLRCKNYTQGSQSVYRPLQRTYHFEKSLQKVKCRSFYDLWSRFLSLWTCEEVYVLWSHPEMKQKSSKGTRKWAKDAITMKYTQYGALASYHVLL